MLNLWNPLKSTKFFSSPFLVPFLQNLLIFWVRGQVRNALKKSLFRLFLNGGGGGIRTHGTRERTTVFKTAPINRSGTPPSNLLDVIQFYLINFFCQYTFPTIFLFFRPTKTQNRKTFHLILLIFSKYYQNFFVEVIIKVYSWHTWI